jgi:hypothetical protein
MNRTAKELEEEFAKEWRAQHGKYLWMYDEDTGKPITWKLDVLTRGRKFDTQTGELLVPGVMTIQAEGEDPVPRSGWAGPRRTYQYNPLSCTVTVREVQWT